MIGGSLGRHGAASKGRTTAGQKPSKGRAQPEQKPAKAKQRPSKGQGHATARQSNKNIQKQYKTIKNTQKHRNAWTRHPGPIGPQLALRTPMHAYEQNLPKQAPTPGSPDRQVQGTRTRAHKRNHSKLMQTDANCGQTRFRLRPGSDQAPAPAPPPPSP